VPVGNAAGDLLSSWTGPTSILVGVMAVASAAYLAAVYLSADAARLGERDLEEWFRTRALIAGALAGGLAVAGLVVLHSDARLLYRGLVEGDGLPALIASGAAGAATLVLVWRRRYELARFSAAAAVAAIVAGWALAQSPTLLPGLTVQQAAAPHDTLVAVIVAVVAGIPILLPSLALLFGLVLRGRFDRERPEAWQPPARGAVLRASRPGLVARAALGCLIAGFGLLNVAEAAWAHALGVVLLFAFIVLGFLAVVPRELAPAEDG
jgi:cytochrome d ubiquinol oxidase subunit II